MLYEVTYVMFRDVDIAKISMAGMAFGSITTCSDRLLLELGTLGMTLRELADCLYATKKFERSLIESSIKSYGTYMYA